MDIFDAPIYDAGGNLFTPEQLKKFKTALEDGLKKNPVHTCTICGNLLRGKNKLTHKKCEVIAKYVK